MPIVAMLVAVAIWGGSFIATKAAIQDLPPVAFALLRFVTATVALLLVHLATRTPLRLPRALWRDLGLAAFLGITLTYVLENTALKFTTAGNSALFIAASPLVSITGAVVFLKERLTARAAAGALLACAAIFALVGGNFAQTGLGDLLMAGNTLVGAGYALVSKRLVDRARPLAVLTVTSGLGAIGLVPFVGLEHWLSPAPWHFTPMVLGGLVYLGIASSALAYWLWMFALRRMAASQAGMYLYLMPVITLGLSAAFLHEPIGPLKALEALGVLLGVYLAHEPPPARRASEQPAATAS